MAKKYDTVTLGQLQKQIQERIDSGKATKDTPIRVWLPGSTIALSGLTDFLKGGDILIEGNVDPGSALG